MTTTKNQEIILAFFFLLCVFPFAFPPRPPEPLLLLQRPEKMVDQIAEKIAREKYKKVRMLFAFLERRRRQEKRGRSERRGEEKSASACRSRRRKRSSDQLAAFLLPSVSPSKESLFMAASFVTNSLAQRKSRKRTATRGCETREKQKRRNRFYFYPFALSGAYLFAKCFFWKPLKIPFKPLSSSLFLFSLTKTGVLRAQQDPEEESQRLPPRGVSQNFDEGSVKEEVKYEKKTSLFFVLERKKHRHYLFRLLSPFLSARGRNEMR